MKYEAPAVIATYSEQELTSEAAVSMSYGRNGNQQFGGGGFFSRLGKWFGH